MFGRAQPEAEAPVRIAVRTPDDVVLEVAGKIEAATRPYVVRAGAALGVAGDLGAGYVAFATLVAPEITVPGAIGAGIMLGLSADSAQANAWTLVSGRPQATGLHQAVAAGATALGVNLGEAERFGQVADLTRQTAQAWKMAMVFPPGMGSGFQDPGVRGTINPVNDNIIFRETTLRRAKIDAVSPFNQALSDAGGQPIRVVVTQADEKFVMQGNHRVRGAQAQGLQSVEGIIYNQEHWEALTGSPFLPRGTNNPAIGPCGGCTYGMERLESLAACSRMEDGYRRGTCWSAHCRRRAHNHPPCRAPRRR